MKSLDPSIAKMLASIAELPGPKYWELSAPEARKLTDDPCFIEQFNGKPESIFEVIEKTIPVSGQSINLRIYVPREISQETTLPVLIYFHGGGWVVGNLDVYEAPLRYLAKKGDCLIVSVGYRLAPEYPFPIPVEDCLAAARWVGEHAPEFGGDASRLAIGGDSSGGNLAAVTSQLCRDRGGPDLALQVLIYPWLTVENDFPSRKKFTDGFFLNRVALDWFVKNYLLNPQDAKNPLVSPLLAGDFRNLPPALILTAGFDPLHDDGIAYAKKLQSAGVPVQFSCYEHMIHGFISMAALTDDSHRALQQCAQTLCEAWKKVALKS